MLRVRTTFAAPRRRVRYLSFYNHKKQAYFVQRMNPSLYGHTSDPAFPIQGPFATRKAAEERCVELRNAGDE